MKTQHNGKTDIDYYIRRARSERSQQAHHLLKNAIYQVKNIFLNHNTSTDQAGPGPNTYTTAG